MKRKHVLVLALCLALLLTACGGSEAAEKPESSQSTIAATVAPVVEETEAVVETVPAPTLAPFLEEGKILLDNEYITITINGEVEESNCVGYEFILENKSDQYILVSTNNTSIDGYMTYLNMQNASVSPGKKAKAKMVSYTTTEGALVTSLGDLKDVEGVFRLSFNSDGGNSYTGNKETYPFSIDGRQGDGLTVPEISGPVLVDNDTLRITLGETFEKSSAIGYKLLLENKSQEYILVSVDNTSVDGFMVNLYMQNASVAPGKSAVAELTSYTSNGDIKSLDEFINVEGVFKYSANTDGGSTYRGNKTTYPFVFASADAAETVQPAASADVTESEVAPAPTEAAASSTAIVLGEPISCDEFDFTVNNVELIYELKPRNTSSVYTSYTAESGKVYIHIDAEYMNKSKKDICIRDLPVPEADYNDGFCYTGFVVVDRGDNSFDWVNSYVVAEPLTTCHYHGLIECPVVIDETGDPLFVTLELNGTTYRYDIR